MKKIKYNEEVIFNNFDFFTGSDAEDNENLVTAVMYDYCLTKACPKCVKKYELYDEAEASPAEIENEIDKGIVHEGHTCGVQGCRNMNAYVLNLELHNIEII